MSYELDSADRRAKVGAGFVDAVVFVDLDIADNGLQRSRMRNTVESLYASARVAFETSEPCRGSELALETEQTSSSVGRHMRFVDLDVDSSVQDMMAIEGTWHHPRTAHCAACTLVAVAA